MAVSALLPRGMNLSTVSTKDFIGKPISSVFDIDIDQLPALMRGTPQWRASAPGAQRSGAFCSAIAPVSSFRAPATSSISVRLPGALRQLSFGDPAMEALQARAAKLADRRLPILIKGETGSGKEYLARAIHDKHRQARSVYRGQLRGNTRTADRIRLFGYVPGAFTGAMQKGKDRAYRSGQWWHAVSGRRLATLPLALQSRLLRVLSENEIQPVGALKPKPVRFRLLSASHRDLAALAAEGRFRERFALSAQCRDR
ncbi:sigma 54-interacting transcriptional regulator [Ochrobactrum soli]|uniref:Transcriptional regulator n=1 Tax=Ochrobactrum soli TaxID=2448455 RepID=A0A2P9HFG5_9HYPH|nr:sigma 54-interacting transcriptional regulator [[Ochrobactrum] soli]SPL62837.1 Transcriptional regulator [[Ochrobactrum] soli]